MNYIFIAFFIAPFFLSAGRAAAPTPEPSKSEVYWIDHDGGFDPDDFLAHVCAARLGDKIIGVSTTFFHPLEKAKLSSLIFKELGFPGIPVYAGLGINDGEDHDFLSRYPAWPPQFGNPYSKQGLAFKEVFGSDAVESSPVQPQAVSALVRAAHAHEHSLVIIVLGPLTNVAAALKQDPSIAKKINRLVIMGGWFSNDRGDIARVGYNTIMDLSAAKEVFANPDLPILLVNSQAIKQAGFVISREEFNGFLTSKNPSRLGQALLKDMLNWQEHSKNIMGNIGLADPITVLSAAFPQIIAKSKPVRIQLESRPGIHMLHKEASSLIQVSADAGVAHIQVVDSFQNPDSIRDLVLADLLALGLAAKQSQPPQQIGP